MRYIVAFIVSIPVLVVALLFWHAQNDAAGITTNSAKNAGTDKVTVYSAAGAAGAMQAIAAEYEKETGVQILYNFASSSVLSRQIEQGAPADIFVSAHPRWIDYLESKDCLMASTRRKLVSNRLVIIAPHGKKKPFTLSGKDDLTREMKGKIAVGDPTHVPVGEYTKEVLKYYDCYDMLSPRFIPAGSVAATVRLVETGEADCGIVYTSSIVGNKKVDILAEVPAETHRPIIFSAALCGATADAPKVAPEILAFYKFLTSPRAQKIMVEHGFDPIFESASTATNDTPDEKKEGE